MATERIDFVAETGDAEKKIASLFQKLQSGSRLSASEIVQLQLIVDRLDGAFATGAVSGEKEAASLAKIRTQSAQLTEQYLQQARAQDALSKRTAGAKTGLDDFGRALGLPIGQLGAMFVGVSTLHGALNELTKEGGLDAYARQAGLSAEETRSFSASIGFLSGLLKGDLIAAFQGIIAAQVKYIENTNAILTAGGRAADGVKAILDARKQETEKMEEQAQALSKLIALEKARGGITDDTRERVQKLVEQYGDKLPAAFLRTSDGIGITQKQLDELNKKGMEANAEITKQQNANQALFTQTKEALDQQAGAIQEGLSLLKLQGKVTQEEADKGAKSVLAQLEAYRQVGEEAPQFLIDLASEWVDLEKQTKKGGDTTRKEVEGMLDAYAEAGDKVPKWLAEIATKVGAVDKEQRKAAESAKEFLKATTETAKQYLEQIEGTIDGLKQRTVAMIAASRAAEADGVVTGKALDEQKKLLQDLMDDYERAGVAIPGDLQQIIDRYGILSKSAEESVEKQRDALKKLRADLAELTKVAGTLADQPLRSIDDLNTLFDTQDKIVEKQKEIQDNIGLFGNTFGDAFGFEKPKEQQPLAQIKSGFEDVGKLADVVVPKLSDHFDDLNAKATITVDLLTQIAEKMASLGE